jgi:hypothetical protein
VRPSKKQISSNKEKLIFRFKWLIVLKVWFGYTPMIKPCSSPVLPKKNERECQIVTQNHTMSRSIQLDRQRFVETVHIWFITWIRDNDPSAGSPTETLLRLLLPLNDQV